MKKKNKKIKSKKGAALAETILLIAVSLVLIVVLFYPQISSLFSSLMSSLSTWFTKATSVIGVIN